jgi:hypothetical protein
LPTNSMAIGRRVWSLMVTQHKSLKEIVKEHRLSTGDEIERSEEAAGWVQNGKIACVFRASAYFCGVITACQPESWRRSRPKSPAICRLATHQFWRVRAKKCRIHDWGKE